MEMNDVRPLVINHPANGPHQAAVAVDGRQDGAPLEGVFEKVHEPLATPPGRMVSLRDRREDDVVHPTILEQLEDVKQQALRPLPPAGKTCRCAALSSS